jgi:hypothetical protein
MANEIGALLNEVGNVLARDTRYPLDGTFLYVEADWGWVGMSIFKDLEDRLLWRDPMEGLADVLLELWEAETPEKRWASMQYRIADGKFEASFTHEPLDPEVTTIDRRASILQERYGNKQIVYPPLP